MPHAMEDAFSPPSITSREATSPMNLTTQYQYQPIRLGIMHCMSETYRSKRERWQRLLETLPAGLREHVSLRNVEAVAALSAQAQQRLAEAAAAGLKCLPQAVEQLKLNPTTSVTDLLKISS